MKKKTRTFVRTNKAFIPIFFVSFFAAFYKNIFPSSGNQEGALIPLATPVGQGTQIVSIESLPQAKTYIRGYEIVIDASPILESTGSVATYVRRTVYAGEL